MTLEQVRSSLEQEFHHLRLQAGLTGDRWSDPVRRRFYAQFMDNLPDDFRNYIASLESMGSTLDRAEQAIAALVENANSIDR